MRDTGEILLCETFAFQFFVWVIVLVTVWNLMSKLLLMSIKKGYQR